jgi:hypothetical protein
VQVEEGSHAEPASIGFRTDHGDEGHHLTRVATKVVRQSQGPICMNLSNRWRLPTELQPTLKEHAQARSADWVSEALEPSVGVERKFTSEVE